jgi:small conductance mechanosensitive channel
MGTVRHLVSRTWRRRLWAAVLALVVSVTAPALGRAQEGDAPPPSAAELEALIATLEDDAARAAFVAQLETLIAANRATAEPAAESSGLLGRVTRMFDRFGRELGTLARDVGGWQDMTDWLGAETGDADRRAVWLTAFAKVVLVLGAAFLVGGLARRALATPSRALFGRWGDDLITRVLVVIGRALVGFLPTVAFAAVAYGILAVIDPRDETRVVALALVNATIVVQLVIALSGAVLAPLATGARPLPVSDETAAYLHVWVRRLARVAAYGGFASEALLLLGVPPVGAGLMLRITGLVFVVLTFMLILQNRAAVADYLRGDGEGDGGRVLRLVLGRVADVWHLLAILGIAVAFAAWAVEAENTLDTIARGVIGTAVIVAAAKLVLLAAHRALDRLLAVGSDIAERMPGVEIRANRYLPVLRYGVAGLVLVVMLVAIGEVWGVDAVEWLTSPWARDVMSRLVAIGGIAVIALLAVEVTDGIVTRFLDAKDAAGNTVVRSARLRTLLPLARNTVLVFVVTIAVFTALAELGVDIGPMLAGAGVIGLAVGFGAQALVKDVITGAFILFENQMAIGDVVELGGTSGVVEGMTIRTITLRDGSGNVHTIPFGNVTMVTNMTRDFAYAVLDITVGYGEDTDRVTVALGALDADLREDSAVAAAVLGPLEVLGVEGLREAGVVVRARVKTRAGQQWFVQRRYLAAIKARFDRDGIDIPFRQRTVVVRHEGAPSAVLAAGGAAEDG